MEGHFQGIRGLGFGVLGVGFRYRVDDVRAWHEIEFGVELYVKEVLNLGIVL